MFAVNPQLLRMFGFAAVIDLLVGVAVALVGVVEEEMALQIVGAALVISGCGVLAFVIVQRNKPTTL